MSVKIIIMKIREVLLRRKLGKAVKLLTVCGKPLQISAGTSTKLNLFFMVLLSPFK